MHQFYRRAIAVLSAAFLMVVLACQNITGNVKAGEGQDSLGETVVVTAEVQKPLLIDAWDSLRRNKIVFTVDSLRPVDIKTQKRLYRDSLRRAFNEKPKHVYLTFDDGPLVGSAAIDSIARAKNIKVNAFMVGRHANMSKGRKRDYERYMNNPLVGCYNHSYTHAFNRFLTFYSNPQKAFEDFQKNETDLALKHKIVRLPGRNIWMYNDVRHVDLNSGVSTADMLFADGYRIYGWDVEWRINGITGVPVQSFEEVYNRIRNFMDNKSSLTPNNVVILMHDDMFQNKKGQQQLIRLVDSLQGLNYKFELIEDYPIRY